LEEKEMNAQKRLKNRIRGWLPQEPLNPNKHMQIKFEANPLELKQPKGKLTINMAQFLAVMLAFGMILSGLYLNSIYDEKGDYNLPVNWESTDAPVEYEGMNYNCTIKLFVAPQLEDNMLGTATEVKPISVYLNEPSNLTAGAYVIKLQYVAYNSSTNSYLPRAINNTGTFAPDKDKKQDLIVFTGYLKPPFDDGSDQITRNVVITLYSNKTGELPPSTFSLTSHINTAQGSAIVTYPYRTQGNILLAAGIISLIAALVISYTNLMRKSPVFKNKPNPAVQPKGKSADNSTESKK
jgi:hypothetical protein